MDPLSITTGVLTLLGACTTASATVSKLRRLKDAPDLVQALNNEISDLRLVLLDVSDHFRSAQNERLVVPNMDETIFELCSFALDQARVKVLEVDAVIQYQVTKPGRGAGLIVDKIAFLRNYNRLLQLQSDLRDTRHKITGLFNHIGVRSFSRIEVVLNEIQANDIPELLQGQRRIESTLNRLVDLQSPTSAIDYKALPPVRTMRLEGADLSRVSVSVSRLTQSTKRRPCACGGQSTSALFETLFGTLFIGYTAVPMACHCHGEHPSGDEKELRLLYAFPLWFLRYTFSVQAKVTVLCKIVQNGLAFLATSPSRPRCRIVVKKF